MRVLGISCWYHAAAACIVEDGRVVAAAQEERFSRHKHDERFPENAIRYCLAEAGPGELDLVAFYENGEIKVGKVLRAFATFDHRVLDGVHAAKMSKTLKRIFDQPEKELGALPPA